MFITRKRLEEIKAHERWEHESKLNREREMSQMRIEIYELKNRLNILERKVDPCTAGTGSDEVLNVPLGM